MRDQRHAEHRFGELFGLAGRFRQLDAATLAATAGVDLRFDDRDVASETPGNLARLRRRERHLTARHRNPVARQH